MPVILIKKMEEITKKETAFQIGFKIGRQAKLQKSFKTLGKLQIQTDYENRNQALQMGCEQRKDCLSPRNCN